MGWEETLMPEPNFRVEVVSNDSRRVELRLTRANRAKPSIDISLTLAEVQAIVRELGSGKRYPRLGGIAP